MGKYIRKPKITGEVAVMEVSQSYIGVRTRAKSLALQNPADRPPQATSTPASYLQLRNRRLLKPIVSVDSKRIRDASGPGSNSRLVSGSVCSDSVGSVSLSSTKNCKSAHLAEEIRTMPQSTGEGCLLESETCVEASYGENILDMEGMDRCRSVRETTPSSLIRISETRGTPGSTSRANQSTATNRRIHGIQVGHIPTSVEMEDFFTCAEQEHQRLFMEKYNFDPVNEVPLPGRYEWIRMEK